MAGGTASATSSKARLGLRLQAGGALLGSLLLACNEEWCGSTESANSEQTKVQPS